MRLNNVYAVYIATNRSCPAISSGTSQKLQGVVRRLSVHALDLLSLPELVDRRADLHTGRQALDQADRH
jgi:hypothetical protein